MSSHCGGKQTQKLGSKLMGYFLAMRDSTENNEVSAQYQLCLMSTKIKCVV